MKNLVSVIVPCYNEFEALPHFLECIAPVRKALQGCKTPADSELIFVDDGSADGTLSLLRKAHEEDSSIRFISFSRNFGKEAGIYAGLEAAKGDFVVLLDADLQHPPEYIPKMYETLTEPATAYDSVAMYRSHRKGEKRIRSAFGKCFYKIINRLSNLDLKEGATDYRMMTRQMVDSILSLKEYNRFSKGIFNWVGYNTLWLPYENVERVAGSTKWSFGGLLRYSMDSMVAFSTTPLSICFWLGFIFCFLSLLFALVVVIRTLIWGNPVAGFPSIFCMILFMGGVQLLFIGILGQYLSRTYMEVKKRPLYLVKERSES